MERNYVSVTLCKGHIQVASSAFRSAVCMYIYVRTVTVEKMMLDLNIRHASSS